MADVFNAIRPGFAFSQDFETDAGAVPDAAQLWLNLRRVTRPVRPPVLSDLFLARISATQFRLSLSTVQTGQLSEGIVEGDFVQRNGGVDTPLGVRITIPVADTV